MPHTFDDAALAGVLGHMNDDHTDDNLLIARAFSPLPDVISSTMTTFDGAAGQWHGCRGLTTMPGLAARHAGDQRRMWLPSTRTLSPLR